MKKYIITASMFLMLAAGFFIANYPHDASAQRSTLGFSYLNKNVATTSVTVLGLGSLTATSTLVLPTPMADQVDVNIQDTPAGSTAVLNWMIQYSDESNCDTASSSGSTFSYINPCDWYTESFATTSPTSLFVESPSATHTWLPGTTATSTKHIVIPNIGANYVRVVFYSTVATSSIWAEANVKSQVQ